MKIEADGIQTLQGGAQFLDKCIDIDVRKMRALIVTMDGQSVSSIDFVMDFALCFKPRSQPPVTQAFEDANWAGYVEDNNKQEAAWG